jgi:hypothetical protein
MADIGNISASTPANSRNLNLNCKGVALGSFPENGDAISISAWLSGTSGQPYRAFIIDAADGTTVLAQSDIRTDITSAADYELGGGTLAGYDLTATSLYIICVGTTENSVALAYYESGTETYDGQSTSSGLTSIDPFDGAMTADSGRDYAIYLTYTAAGGGATIVNRESLRRGVARGVMRGV